MSLLKRLGLDVTPLRTSRDYRLLFIGQTVSGFGSFFTYVSIPFQVAALTHDPLAVGAIGVCELVPLLVMAFVGGALADYLDRRLLVRGGEFALTALTGVLLVNALAGRPHLWLLYVVAALSAGRWGGVVAFALGAFAVVVGATASDANAARKNARLSCLLPPRARCSPPMLLPERRVTGAGPA